MPDAAKAPRGHWTKGKRRNPDPGDWETIRQGLMAILEEHAEPGVISRRSLATACGVTDKTVARWLTAVDRPSPDSIDVCRSWLRQRRADIAKRRRHQSSTAAKT